MVNGVAIVTGPTSTTVAVERGTELTLSSHLKDARYTMKTNQKPVYIWSVCSRNYLINWDAYKYRMSFSLPSDQANNY